MKAKLVKDTLNESIFWPAMIAGLYFLYKFIKGTLSKSEEAGGLDKLQQQFVILLLERMRRAITKHEKIEHSEDVLYHIFEFGGYFVKINKQDRTLLYKVNIGSHIKTWNALPIKLTKDQYDEFISILNKENK